MLRAGLVVVGVGVTGLLRCSGMLMLRFPPEVGAFRLRVTIGERASVVVGACLVVVGVGVSGLLRRSGMLMLRFPPVVGAFKLRVIIGERAGSAVGNFSIRCTPSLSNRRFGGVECLRGDIGASAGGSSARWERISCNRTPVKVENEAPQYWQAVLSRMPQDFLCFASPLFVL